MSAPFDIFPGVTVEVEPPVLPVVSTPAPEPSNVVVLPIAGPPGDTGPQGPPGEVVAPYMHTQTTPQSVVTINHNRGYRPSSVSLYNLDFSQQYSEFTVQHLDPGTLRITVETPTPYIALIA